MVVAAEVARDGRIGDPWIGERERERVEGEGRAFSTAPPAEVEGVAARDDCAGVPWLGVRARRG